MDETALLWSRAQFALTNMFHYIYPPLSIGISLFLVVVTTLYMLTRQPVWLQVARFWIKVFALTFTIGVATGIPMEFQFGTNWADYSRFVGDVFGSALAAEGVFAFFLESGFLALLLFGAGRIPVWLHYLSTILVAAGAHFSAMWIVVANSWMQTPAGFHVVDGPNGARAEVTDFWAMVWNPSSGMRLTHVLMGAWLAGAFFVMSVSAFYLLRRRHEEFARASVKVALPIATIIALGQLLYSGHESARIVAQHQPVKFAAMEGHWEDGTPGDLTVVGWIDEAGGTTHGLQLPGMTSWLLSGDTRAPVPGLSRAVPADRPPLQITFQAYHAMIGIGMSLIALSLLGCVLWMRGALWRTRPVLWCFVFAVFLPMAANELGWIAAEVGRQPWIVQGLMRTAQGVSPQLSGGQVIGSTTLFLVVYLLLFAVFVFVLDRKIRHGPDEPDVSGPIVPLPGRLADAVAGALRHDDGRADA